MPSCKRPPPEPMTCTLRFPDGTTPRTHLPMQSVAVEQEDQYRLLRCQQEQTSSQVDAIFSQLTAMESHLKEITNTMAVAESHSQSLPASRSRQRLSTTVSVSLLHAPVCSHYISQWHYRIFITSHMAHSSYAYAEKGEGIALCPCCPV